MNQEEYESLQKFEGSTNIIHGKDLTNQRERTLLYGYDGERNTWHVYLKDSIIHVVVYRPTLLNFQMLQYQNEHSITRDNEYVPNKRIYPNRSDLEFCILLKGRGVYLCFTNYEENQEQDFYGLTYEDFGE